MRKFVASPITVTLSILLAPLTYARPVTAAAISGPASGSSSVAQPIYALTSDSTVPEDLRAAPDSGVTVVTPQRGGESLLRAQIAVTALTAAVRQTLVPAKMSEIAPVTLAAAFTTSTGLISPDLPGVGSGFVSVGIGAPLAVYEDGACLPRTLTLDEIIYNFAIGGIQTLRGPRGMLYGRNATGAVMIINSADPTDKFEARVRGELRNFVPRQINGMVKIPLADDLTLCASSSFKRDVGFVRNLPTGDQDNGRGGIFNVRAKLSCQLGPADIVPGGSYYTNTLS